MDVIIQTTIQRFQNLTLQMTLSAVKHCLVGHKTKVDPTKNSYGYHNDNDTLSLIHYFIG